MTEIRSAAEETLQEILATMGGMKSEVEAVVSISNGIFIFQSDQKNFASGVVNPSLLPLKNPSMTECAIFDPDYFFTRSSPGTSNFANKNILYPLL